MNYFVYQNQETKQKLQMPTCNLFLLISSFSQLQYTHTTLLCLVSRAHSVVCMCRAKLVHVGRESGMRRYKRSPSTPSVSRLCCGEIISRPPTLTRRGHSAPKFVDESAEINDPLFRTWGCTSLIRRDSNCLWPREIGNTTSDGNGMETLYWCYCGSVFCEPPIFTL